MVNLKNFINKLIMSLQINLINFQDHDDVGDLLAKNKANFSIATDSGYSLLHLAVSNSECSQY